MAWSRLAKRALINWCVAAAVAMAFLPLLLAHAESSSLRIYDVDQGLASLGGGCLVQDPAGYLLICTEHGVFTYDGRRFVNLGPEQGMRAGGLVYGVTLTTSGRVAVSFADEVFVSDRATDAAHPPGSLRFAKVLHPGLTFYDEHVHHIAPWRDSIVLLAGAATEVMVLPPAGAPHFEAVDYNATERKLLDDTTAVFSVRGSLWEPEEDGRLCAAEPGAVRCYGPADGLEGGPWRDVKPGPGITVMARSATSVASFDPATGRWTTTLLPDQGGRYVNYRGDLALFRTPDGGFLTQAEHGLVVLRPDGWRQLRVEDGAPPGIITSALTDSSGQIWFQVLGRGLVRWVGYGHWEAVQKSDGLSDGIPWMTARLQDGSLWVSTDTGVDEVMRQGLVLRVGRVLPGASFAVAAGPHGEVWRSFGSEGVQVFNPSSGATTRIASPPVDTILAAADGTVWLGTEAGLFKVASHAGLPPAAVQVGRLDAKVPDIVSDKAGGVFYLAAGRLRHVRPDGSDAAVTGDWPGDGFDPLALALGDDGTVWIGGAGGLCAFTLAADRIVSYRTTPVANTRTNSIVALLVDHRGWVWAGTGLGVSVSNGKRWVSVDADGGLLSDDVDQGGLREDPDGSVWIVTTQGVSHLIDPTWLFTERPIQAVVSTALLGGNMLDGHLIPFTRDALDLQFGSPSHGAERSFKFRYQLSGVDDDWAESASGGVHYPYVPPGHHMLTVVGYDELTHSISAPARLTIDIAFPWWRQWWAEALWVLAGIVLIYSAMQLRLRAILTRQAELKRYVAEGTEQLRYQAAHDSLTGLLNRAEIERRLAAKLSNGSPTTELIVALLDIDHFKTVNDGYGHLGGDDVLRAMGRLVRKAVRVGEYAGRYGGEEILLVLDDTDGCAAERVLDLHHAVRGESFSAAGKELRVTCSVGLAWAVRGDDWESLIGRADQALYEAKAAGRDRVVEQAKAGFEVSGRR